MFLLTYFCRAYFTDGLDISSNDVLRDLLSGCGLNAEEGLSCLESDEYLQLYRTEIKEANDKG